MSRPEQGSTCGDSICPPTGSADVGQALRCLRWDAEGDRLLATIADQTWPSLIALLDERGGLALLARRFKRSGLAPPGHVAARLRANGMAIAVKNLRSRMALAQAIAATGRPAILLKGIDLADRLYGNPGHRPMGDVDFLVRGVDAMAYHEHLTRQGFRARHPPDEATRSVEWHRHVYYSPPPDPAQLPFELHWLLANGKAGAAVDMEGIWARSLPHPELGEHARIMGPDDLLLYLCLHLRNHAFEAPLTNFWDIAELVESSTFALDWDAIWQRAGEWGLTEGVRIALHLVSKTLGVDTRQISSWTPEADLERLLPDGLALLGRHSADMPIAGARLGTLLAGGSGWRSRGEALVRGIVPSRLEVRLRYGHADQGFIEDLRSYWRRWRTIGGERFAATLSWASGERGLREKIDKIAQLRAHLEQNSRPEGERGHDPARESEPVDRTPS